MLNGIQKDMLWSSNINLKWKKFHKPLTGSQFCLFLLSVLQHTLCTPGFLRRQDGKLHAVQFLAPADSDLTPSNTDTMHTHTHQYHSKPLNKKCFLSCLQHYCPLAALLLITVCWLKLYQHSNTTSKMLSHTLPIVSFSKNTFGEYHLQQFHRVIHFC